jgi:predicted PurR-regulated permease PerM
MTPPELKALPWRFAAVALGLLVSLWLLRQALMPFFVAMVLAYLLGPVVDLISRRANRTFAVALVLFLTVGLAIGVLALLVPFLLDQGSLLLASLPKWRSLLEQKLAPLAQAHPGWAAKVRQGLEGIDPSEAFKGLLKAGTGVLNFFLSTLSLLLVPLILYHLLEGGRDMLTTLENLVPPRFRARVDGMAGDIHERLGGYIRGQLAVAVVMSLLQSLAFYFLGVPYAWILGPIAGFFNLIPYSPYLVALLPALVLLGLEGAGAGHICLAAGVFTAVQKVEALYLTPVWVGRASKLHSLEVLLALIAFGHWFGLLGLLFAVPLMVCVRVVLERLLEDYREHPWFTGISAT